MSYYKANVINGSLICGSLQAHPQQHLPAFHREQLLSSMIILAMDGLIHTLNP